MKIINLLQTVGGERHLTDAQTSAAEFGALLSEPINVSWTNCARRRRGMLDESLAMVNSMSTEMPNSSIQTQFPPIVPFLAGIVGAAQLSMACLIWDPSSGTDFLIAGAVSSHMWWSLPVGALLGVSLPWAIISTSRCPRQWRYWRLSWLGATIFGVGPAAIAPMFLGLAPQSQAQMWQGFAVIFGFAWFCLAALTGLEYQQRQ